MEKKSIGTPTQGDTTGRKIWFAIAIVGILLVLCVALIIYAVILSEECYVSASRVKPSYSETIHTLPDNAFSEHPALEELLVRNKFVLVSYGPVIDALLWLDPRSRAHSAGKEGSYFSTMRISQEEKWRLLEICSPCEYNGTVYLIIQSA